MAEPNARDSKLIQYLNEAYGTEKQLETALQAHIQMTTRKPYKKRLQEHLRETKRHAREVERRIKQLGGRAETVSVPGPGVATEAAQRVQEVAGRAVAAAQGPVHMLRGTGEEEKQLKNAKTEYQSEAEEIATYRSIQTLASAVGDRDTEKLARSILREEERMAKFLERQIDSLTKAVASAEIPRGERNTGRRRSSSAASRSSGSRTSSASRSTSSRSGASSGRAKSGGTRAKASGTRSKSSGSRAKAGGTRAKSSGSRAKAGGTRAKSSGTRAKSGRTRAKASGTRAKSGGSRARSSR